MLFPGIEFCFVFAFTAYHPEIMTQCGLDQVLFIYVDSPVLQLPAEPQGYYTDIDCMLENQSVNMMRLRNCLLENIGSQDILPIIKNSVADLVFFYSVLLIQL